MTAHATGHGQSWAAFLGKKGKDQARQMLELFCGFCQPSRLDGSVIE